MLKRRAELRATAMDPAAHGAELDTEHVGYLLVGQPFDVAQDHGGPVLGRQIGKRRGYVGIQVPIVECLRRCRLGPAELGLGFLTEALEPDPLLAAGDVEEQVGRYPVQPALECPWGVRGLRPEYANEDLLRKIFRVMAVACEAVGEPVDPSGMLADHFFPAWRRPSSIAWLSHIGTVHRFGPHRPSFAPPIVVTGWPAEVFGGVVPRASTATDDDRTC